MLTHLRSIWTFRHFWLALVRSDLRTRYRRSVLGIGWSVLNPILMSFVIVLGFAKVLNAADVDDSSGALFKYGAFLLTGMCTWDFMRNSMSQGAHALTHNESYIRQCPLPYGIYPLRTVAGTGIHFLITLTVVVPICCVLMNTTTPLEMMWVLPPIVVLLFVFCWSMAAIMAFANAYFHDTHHLIEVVMTFLFFLTPVMIPPDRQGKYIQLINEYNPFNVFLQLIRAPLYHGMTPSVELWLQGMALTAVVFGAACLVIGTLQRRVIFQL